MQIQRTYHIDSLGNCSDGTNMWNWSVDRLTHVINTCWYKDVSDLAKMILQRNLDKINKTLTKN